MDEYIKRDELAKALADLMISPWATESHIMHCAGIHEALHLVQDMVNDEVPKSWRLPAADVVEVVRCKDCRFCMEFKDKSDGFYGHCRLWITRTISDYAALVDADGYCSHGERKEGQQ